MPGAGMGIALALGLGILGAGLGAKKGSAAAPTAGPALDLGMPPEVNAKVRDLLANSTQPDQLDQVATLLEAKGSQFGRGASRTRRPTARSARCSRSAAAGRNPLAWRNLLPTARSDSWCASRGRPAARDNPRRSSGPDHSGPHASTTRAAENRGSRSEHSTSTRSGGRKHLGETRSHRSRARLRRAARQHL